MDYKSGFNGGYKKDAGRKKEVRSYKKTVRQRRGGIVLPYPASNTLCEPRPNSSQLYIALRIAIKTVKVGKKLERTPAE